MTRRRRALDAPLLKSITWTAAEMKLASKDGQKFEMRIAGYQFPHLETADYDSNWLIIAGEVIHPKGS
jgi:hypothetical protein